MRNPSDFADVRDRSVAVLIPFFVVPFSTRRRAAAASAESFDKLPVLVAPKGLALTVLHPSSMKKPFYCVMLHNRSIIYEI